MRSAHQSKVVQAMADISLPAAIELLRSITNPAGDFENQTSAIGKVTQLLLGKGEFDRAIEIVNLVPEGADALVSKSPLMPFVDLKFFEYCCELAIDPCGIR